MSQIINLGPSLQKVPFRTLNRQKNAGGDEGAGCPDHNGGKGSIMSEKRETKKQKEARIASETAATATEKPTRGRKKGQKVGPRRIYDNRAFCVAWIATFTAQLVGFNAAYRDACAATPDADGNPTESLPPHGKDDIPIPVVKGYRDRLVKHGVDGDLLPPVPNNSVDVTDINAMLTDMA